MSLPFHLSQRARQTAEPPISYFMEQAVGNPGLISLAAGLVDGASLPADDVRGAVEQILRDPARAREALQYGTTQGYAPLREKILANLLALDHVSRRDLDATPDDVVVTTGSQQLLYLLGELLFDPGDIVITEAPSYFVYHGILASLGVRTLAVPMDQDGMSTDALDELLQQLERAGELGRVRLVYTVDYFQNPSGLSLSRERRRQLLDIVQRFSKQQRIFILEDAAYRELRYEGDDAPSIKSLDAGNQHVILTMTFSKPLSPGLKTGYGLLPRDLVGPLLRFKGNHDFGSSNFNQHVLDQLLANGVYDRHVEELRGAYRRKRDIFVAALREEFPASTGMRFANPEGGMYVWLTCPEGLDTGLKSPFMKACIKEGVLYVPGECCYVGNGATPCMEARLCFGVATPEELREAARRLGRAARAVGLPRRSLPRAAGCRA
ncbi:MAG: PLP-dependent aminotransferase family protein [Gemmataceae bacterium]|nr:PLP-dependent aminotransferase family protein [Gemmataceae bacterium]